MGRSRRARVNIPELRGGVNYREAMNVVEDNQLTDVRNMWFKDGVLRTRPGLKIPHEDGVGYTDAFDAFEIGTMCYCPSSGYTFVRAIKATSQKDIEIHAFDVDGYHIGYVVLPTGTGGTALICPFERLYNNVNYVAVCYTRSAVYGLYVTGNTLSASFLEPYIPIVSINGKGASAVGTDAAAGTLIEGYNLLTNKYRAFFNTDAESTRYVLPATLGIADCTVVYTQGDTVWTWELLGYSATKENDQATTITAKISDDMQAVEFSAPLPEVSGRSNNLCVTANDDRELLPIIPSAQTFAWFGGSRSGIYGGTRLFVGCTGYNKNRMYWSGLDDPLYFSENNYVNVGSGDEPITVFGKQSDMLVIFKERELYYTTYVKGEEYTAEDVMEGRVVDVSTLDATFPITQLSGKTGCDLPQTVQLMQNRLVWADSNGKVWSLVYSNEYSQRNIRSVGGMIERKLAAHNLNHVISAAYGDYYLLLINEPGEGTVGYALDTAEYGYSHYTSYGNDRKAQRSMAWYAFDFPLLDSEQYVFIGSAECGNNTVLYAMSADFLNLETLNRAVIAYTFAEGEDETTDFAGNYTAAPISCMFQTKLFDMGSPEKIKTFDRLYIGFGRTENLAAGITYVTEKGSFEDSYIARAESIAALHTAQFVETQTLTPNMRCRRFAVRVENEGEMYVDGLGLSYKI